MDEGLTTLCCAEHHAGMGSFEHVEPCSRIAGPGLQAESDVSRARHGLRRLLWRRVLGSPSLAGFQSYWGCLDSVDYELT